MRNFFVLPQRSNEKTFDPDAAVPGYPSHREGPWSHPNRPVTLRFAHSRPPFAPAPVDLPADPAPPGSGPTPSATPRASFSPPRPFASAETKNDPYMADRKLQSLATPAPPSPHESHAATVAVVVINRQRGRVRPGAERGGRRHRIAWHAWRWAVVAVATPFFRAGPRMARLFVVLGCQSPFSMFF